MKLSQFKSILEKKETLAFELPNGELVPRHFHITEVGKTEKHFIDCGGTERKATNINFQLWEANDYDHRLHPDKLMKIINLSQERLFLPDEEIEVEYQGETIGKYFLEYENDTFKLVSTTTDCLAKDACGIPTEKVKMALSSIVKSDDNCTPGGGCC